MQYLESDLTTLPPAIPGTDEDLAGRIGEKTACVVVQNPDVFGRVRDLAPIAAATHEAGALLIAVVTEPVSLGLVRPPGEMGADVVAAEGQGLGNALNFGGPYLGLFATREKYVRQMPGRIAGEARDADGRRGWVLTLSAREQHIRREKATSNICTNSGLCALAFTIHLSLLGEDGFRRLAELNHARAMELADGLGAIEGVELLNDTFFNEVTVRLPVAARIFLAGQKLVVLGQRVGIQLQQNLLVAHLFTVGEWNVGRVEDWKMGRLEDCFEQLASFQNSRIPSFQSS